MDDTTKFETDVEDNFETEGEVFEHIPVKNEGNGFNRRKSSVLFNPILENFEPVDLNQEYGTTIMDNDNENDLASISYQFPSSNRSSIFSKISGMSFETISSKYMGFFVFFSYLIIFIMGIMIGALLVNIFISFGSFKGQVYLNRAAFLSLS